MQSGRLASDTPGFFGAVIGMAAGLACFVYGLAGLLDETTAIPLDLTFVAAGFLNVVLCFFAMKRDRAAWAFALALNGTCGLIMLFRAIQLGGEISSLDIGAVLLCAALIAAAILLSLAAAEYEPT